MGQIFAIRMSYWEKNFNYSLAVSCPSFDAWGEMSELGSNLIALIQIVLLINAFVT